MEPLLLTTAQVAELLNVSPSTVKALRSRGVITPVTLGRAIRYRASDIQDLVNGKPGDRVTKSPTSRSQE